MLEIPVPPEVSSLKMSTNFSYTNSRWFGSRELCAFCSHTFSCLWSKHALKQIMNNLLMNTTLIEVKFGWDGCNYLILEAEPPHAGRVDFETFSLWHVHREDLNWTGECMWSRSYGHFWLLTLRTWQQNGLPKITLGIGPLAGLELQKNPHFFFLLFFFLA